MGHTAQHTHILPAAIPASSSSANSVLRQRIGEGRAHLKRCRRREHVMHTVQRLPGYGSGAVSLPVMLWPSDSRQRQRQGAALCNNGRMK